MVVDHLFKSQTITAGWLRISGDPANGGSVERRVLLGAGAFEGDGGSPEPWKYPVVSAAAGGAFVVAGDEGLALWRRPEIDAPRPTLPVSVRFSGTGAGEMSFKGGAQTCERDCTFEGIIGDIIEVSAHADATSVMRSVSPCTRFRENVCLMQLLPGSDDAVTLDVSFDFTPMVSAIPLFAGPGTLQILGAVRGPDQSVYVHGTVSTDSFVGTTARITDGGDAVWHTALSPGLQAPFVDGQGNLVLAGVVGAGTDLNTGSFSDSRAVFATYAKDDGSVLDVRSVAVEFQSLRGAAVAPDGTSLVGL
ncbi:MAG: hypothetical protein ACO3JL_22135, partial [Myxococcota bacterium]